MRSPRDALVRCGGPAKYEEYEEDVMPKVERAIEVEAPLQVVYNQWTQFEEFPEFMEGVTEVRQIDPRRLAWKAEIAGDVAEWEAQIDEQEPDEIIAWHTVAGRGVDGSVSFR